jgi:ribosomal protein S18 acetylase RimI-like enzyme
VDRHAAEDIVRAVARVIERPALDWILRFCAEDPVERVFLEDVARRGLGRFVGVAASGRLDALCHVGANVVPSGRGVAALGRHAARGEPRMMVGEEGAVTELWEAVSRRMPAPIDDRLGQPVFVMDVPPARAGTGLRPATLADLDLLVPACAAAYLEEVGVDAHARDPSLFRWRTRSQIELGRSWVWLDEGIIRFKAEASAWTPSAVQLQQVWVDPKARRHGYAKRALSDLCAELLERTPTVCLFARPENEPALALYESIGMRRTITYRSLIFS